MDLVSAVTQWYFVNKRDLPWRETTDPYAIWVSEIILQQTRVAQGMDYYLRFLERFPDVFSLASASEEEVLKLWQGLGYYSRARNMHASARSIVSERSGVFPSTYVDLLSLRGVGPYTAAAIASFAFKEAVPAVDGNVHRVFSRLFGINDSVGSPVFNRQMSVLAEKLMDAERPDVSNQAWMEFGALMCSPHHPGCAGCPLSEVCVANAQGLQDLLPVKAKKAAVQSRFLHYVVINYRDSTYIRRRPAGDIWQGLFEFPLIEDSRSLSLPQLMAQEELKHWIWGQDVYVRDKPAEFRHRLSHRLLHVSFVEVDVDRAPRLPEEYCPVSRSQIGEYAVPRIIDEYLHRRG